MNKNERMAVLSIIGVILLMLGGMMPTMTGIFWVFSLSLEEHSTTLLDLWVEDETIKWILSGTSALLGIRAFSISRSARWSNVEHDRDHQEEEVCVHIPIILYGRVPKRDKKHKQ